MQLKVMQFDRRASLKGSLATIGDQVREGSNSKDSEVKPLKC